MPRYGNRNLQLNDRDAPGAGAHPVGRLQQDLRELGFRIVPPPTGSFDLHTEWGVREFQIYARMSHVAEENGSAAMAQRPYLERLRQVATGADRYTGPVSGVVNQETRAALQHWLNNRWRCPVVIQARTGSNHAAVFQGHENIWRHDEVRSTAPRMFARDFTTYYPFPPGRKRDDLVAVGDYQSYLTWSGPRSVPPAHVWREGELLPEHLVAMPLNALSAAQRSSYKVVRAVAEVECIAFFDSVNAYDNAFVSFGPCHWTLGIVSGPQVDEGELGGYLAYLRHADPAAFSQAIEFFGVRIDEDWVHNGSANGQNLKVSAARKYVGWPAQQQESGGFARMARTETHGNYFKTWHWFYRFVMAGRTIDGYRRRMWDMARVRIRDIRDVEWGGPPAVADAGARRARIEDVFTSERTTAILLRWHIRAPGDVVSGGQAGGRIRAALQRARQGHGGLGWDGDPKNWSNAHEAALVKGLMDEAASSNYFETLDYVNKWPDWGHNPRRFALDPAIGRLADTRASLVFDGSGLPPAPTW